MKNKLALLMGFFGAGLALNAVAQDPNEGVFLDPRTGDYRVRFVVDDGVIAEGIFYPGTKINPVTRSKAFIMDDGRVEYRFNIRNGKTSKQDIEQIIIYVSSASSESMIIPPGWVGDVALNIGGTGNIVGWDSRIYRYGIGVVTNKNDPRWNEPALLGIPPGGEATEFGFRSQDLPGVGVIRHIGAAAITRLPGEGPDPDSPVGKAYHELRQKDFVPRLAATPKIPNPTPFNAITVLTGIQNHLKDDLVPMKLIEPVFAERFGSLLQAAIEAAKGGNTPGLESHLKELRKMLKGFGELGENNHAADIPEDQVNTKLWPHPIAKLAAWVLDYDLAYVEKRI